MSTLSIPMRRRYRAVTMSLLNFCPGIRREVSSAQQLEILAHWGQLWSSERIALTRGLQEFIEGRISEGDLRSLGSAFEEHLVRVDARPSSPVLAPATLTGWRRRSIRRNVMGWVDDFLGDNGARYFPVFGWNRWGRYGQGPLLGPALRPREVRRVTSLVAWLEFVRPGSDLLVALALARTRKKGRFAQLKALVLTENGASILAAVRMARALDLLPQMSAEARQLGLEKIT